MRTESEELVIYTFKSMPATGSRSYAQKDKKLIHRKVVLRLPDLDHAKSSVLSSLSSTRSRRNYKFAMEQFIIWYRSLLLEKADEDSLLGYGLRQSELAGLRKEDIQIRQGHWSIVDLVGKGSHVRTVPVPIWFKKTIASIGKSREFARRSDDAMTKHDDR